jgi:hypothetical protein
MAASPRVSNEEWRAYFKSAINPMWSSTERDIELANPNSTPNIQSLIPSLVSSPGLVSSPSPIDENHGRLPLVEGEGGVVRAVITAGSSIPRFLACVLLDNYFSVTHLSTVVASRHNHLQRPRQ